ncbi:hypothetical protein [Nocardia sp. NPDC052112]|uniref:hypothetical protein n=1 Tax=Nocardia sp. NPDC052112 TaxID=3155646 RepID=UPI00342210AC
MTDPLWSNSDAGLAIPAVRVQMLRAIQNFTVEIGNAENRARRANQEDADLTAAWRRQLWHLNRSRQLMREQATAIGIAQHAIDHVQARGTNGLRWRGDQMIPDAVAADRAGLLARLGTQVQQLEDMVAVRAAHNHRFGAADPDQQSFFDARMIVLRNHIGAVAHALEVTTSEREQLWSTDDTSLRQTLQTRMHGYDNDTLTARWLEYASLPQLLSAELRLEALTSSGISLSHAHAAGHMPPSPHHLIAVAAPARNIATTDVSTLTDPDSNRSAGVAIGQAIGATGIDTDTDATSDATDVDVGALGERPQAGLPIPPHQPPSQVNTERGIEP